VGKGTGKGRLFGKRGAFPHATGSEFPHIVNKA
jgi:hypothetical protein